MQNRKHPTITVINILIFFALLLFYYTGILPLTVKGVTPLLILPLLTAYSIYHSPIASALTGAACGIFMDSIALGSYGFNAVVLLILGTLVAIAANNLFNKNIFAATVLSLITCIVYFILQWAFFNTDNVSLNDSLIYLLKYALPTSVYSAVFILPFYYLYRYFDKRLSE